MAEDLTPERIKELRELIHSYSPDCIFSSEENSLETIDNSEILLEPSRILSHLQTAFFEEHLLEIQIDKSTRVFFASIVDHLPELEEEESDGDLVIVEPDYEPGSYLQWASHFLLTPLTPGVGNARIRTSDQVIVRYFAGTSAVEFGCSFEKQTSVRDIPVLQLNYPIFGRVNKSYRPFRVKAISSVDAKVHLISPKVESEDGKGFQLVDVSAFGLGFEVPDDEAPCAQGDDITLLIKIPGITDLIIGGNVRHISKVRDKKGYKNICGLQFDLETRALAAEIEQIVAAIQRMQLREMAEKTSDLQNVSLIK